MNRMSRETEMSPSRKSMPRQMSRRGLITAGVGLATLGGAVSGATRVWARDEASLVAHQGKTVVLTGRLVPGDGAARHYFTLLGESGDLPVRILPKDVRRMTIGRKVSVRGRLQLGKFDDAVSGRIARVLMTAAEIV